MKKTNTTVATEKIIQTITAYLKLDDNKRMFVEGVMQGMLLAQPKESEVSKNENA